SCQNVAVPSLLAVISDRPSRVKLKLHKSCVFVRNDSLSFQLATSHRRRVPSPEPAANVLPSRVKARHPTEGATGKPTTSLPVAASHTRTVGAFPSAA